MSGIEFLDEVADRPADRTPRATRRWWLLGGLVLALVIIWALTRPVEHARSMPEAVPTHVPLATSSPIAPEEDLCREEPNCQRTTVVPLVLRKVINRYLPGPVRITVQSYLTKSLFDGATYLVARRIDVVAGPATVAILILRDVQANRRAAPTGYQDRTVWHRSSYAAIPSDTWSVFSTWHHSNAVAVGGAAASARDRAWAGVHVSNRRPTNADHPRDALPRL